MNIRDLLREGSKNLKKAGIQNANFEAELLLAHVLKWDRVALYTRYDEYPKKQTVDAYIVLIKKRMDRMPYAYLIGKKEFMGLSFNVSNKVLIPRPDTESLVSDFFNSFGQILSKKNCTILDLCTGSGAIGLSIAKFYPKTKVILSDISIDALTVAEKNLKELDLHNVEILQSDLFRSLQGRSFDFIFSNPPYIKSDAIQYLEKDISDYEPKSALDGGEDGLLFYRKILDQAPTFLNEKGYLLLELGDGQDRAIRTMLDHGRLNFVKYILDLSRRIRGILLQRK